MALANRAIAVPIVAVITSFHILIGSIIRPVRLALLPYLGDHIIVCGSRTLTEAALTTLAKRRRRVVIVASTVDDVLEGLGLTIVEGDPPSDRTRRRS